MPKKRPGGMLSTTAANLAATVAAIYKALPKKASTATGGKRKGRTGTKTVLKPKTDSRLAQRVIGGSGNKSTYVENHKLKGSKRVLAGLTPTNFYQYNNAWRIGSNPGLQTANSALYFHQPDLLQQITQFGASANNSKQMLIKSLFADYTLVNTTSAPIYLTIYDVGFKREMDTSDTTTWSPELAWNNGEIQEGNAIGASMVGSDPKKISLFKEYYAVKKKSNHFLAPGEVHKHTVLVRPNKFITKNRILDSIRYAGLTYATMFVAKGTPVDTSGNTTFDVSGVPAYSVPFESYYDSSGNPIAPPLTAGQTVTTGPIGIDVVCTWKYGYQWTADVDADVVAVNQLVSPAINTLEIMNQLGQVAGLVTS